MMLPKFFLCGTLMSLAALAACSNSQVADNSSQQTAQANLPVAQAASPTVIDLTQVGCQFLEVESQDFDYQPQRTRAELRNRSG